MRHPKTLFATLAALTLTAAIAQACHVDGYVRCASTGDPLAQVRIDVHATDGSWDWYGISTDNGYYQIALPCEPHCFTISLHAAPGEAVVSPASGTYEFCTDASNNYVATGKDWLLSSPACPEVQPQDGCWLTAGGAKFKGGTGADFKEHNWGGNVYPGCSSTAGDGGNWNDIDAVRNLHFQGRSIHVIRCGNVTGIPAGSKSPVTPYNFIEFEGRGRVQGVAGNKASYDDVYFWAHVEDRAEPGSKGAKSEIVKDRYFLNVFTNPADPVGSSVLLCDVDGDPATMDPVTITDGNMQLHASSCDAPVVASGATLTLAGDESAAPAAVAFLGSPAPNPVVSRTTLRFGVPSVSHVSLRVYDAAGRVVRELENGRREAGSYASTWDLTGNDGARVARGVYFARLSVGKQVFTQVVTVGR